MSGDMYMDEWRDCSHGIPMDRVCNACVEARLVTREPSQMKKDTNPKDAVGIKKVPFSTIPAPVMAEIGIAMLEGARKYGRHNYRISSVRFSVYYDAALRHITSWWEGQDNDPDSGLSHITKALASLTVLRDAMIQNKVVDDRPPVSPLGWEVAGQERVNEIFERHPTATPAFTEKEHGAK